MEEYTANSHKSKEEKDIKKVVTGEVKLKKKTFGEKLTNSIVSEDAANVKNYILADVLIPAVKKGLYDIITNGIEMVLYGDSKSPSRNRDSGSRVSYRSYYDNRDSRRPEVSRIRSSYNYDDIILSTRMEAEEVLNSMYDILDQYKVVSVADYYDLVGEKGRYTDNNYGWTNLQNAVITRTRDGEYMIKLPKAMPLD